MTIQQLLKLIVSGASIVLIGYLLRGHDILTGIALVLLLLTVILKVVFALRSRGGGPPPSGGGSDPSGRPVVRPFGGGPPELLAVAEDRR